jgi:hypothetical protein
MDHPDDLDAWLAALAGQKSKGEGDISLDITFGPLDAYGETLDAARSRKAIGGQQNDMRDAARLHQVIGRQEIDIGDQIERTAIPQSRATHQLLFRLRREGLLGKPLLQRWQLPLALAASIVAVTLVIFQMPRQDPQEGLGLYDEPPAYRGTLQERTIRAKNPREASEQLRAELQGAGIPAKIFRDAAGYYVDFEVSAGSSAVIGRNLVPGGLVPMPGTNRFVITAQ